MEEVMIENLKKLMRRAGDNSYSLAEKCAVSQPTISRILNNKHNNPRLETVRKFASAYNVTISQLIGDEPLEFDVSGEIIEIFKESNKTKKLLYRATQNASEEQVANMLKIADLVREYNPDKKNENGENNSTQ